MASRSSKKRWDADYAASILNDAKKSGLSDQQFAKRRGIDPQRLAWWRKRLGHAKAPEANFVEVEVSPLKALAELKRVEIRLANGRVVVAQVDTDLYWLPQLLDAIEGVEG